MGARHAIAFLVAGPVIAACGGGVSSPPVDMHVGFKMQALACQIEGLQGRMQVLTSNGVLTCQLMVNMDDDTVSGTCARVPTGGIPIFRLEYYVILPDLKGDNVEVQLAVFNQMLDLRGVKGGPVILDLSGMAPDTNFDDDMDGTSNIIEVCTGRNPLDPNS
jgi:hypothetical protein